MKKLGKVKTENHGLDALIGKTILSVECQEYDMHEDGSNVREFYLITVSDTKEPIIISAEGNCDAQYAEIIPHTKEELEELIALKKLLAFF